MSVQACLQVSIYCMSVPACVQGFPIGIHNGLFPQEGLGQLVNHRCSNTNARWSFAKKVSESDLPPHPNAPCTDHQVYELSDYRYSLIINSISLTLDFEPREDIVVSYQGLDSSISKSKCPYPADCLVHGPKRGPGSHFGPPKHEDRKHTQIDSIISNT